MSAALVSLGVAAALAVGGPPPASAAAPAPAPAEVAPAPAPAPAPVEPSTAVPPAEPADPSAALVAPTSPAEAAPTPTVVLQPAPAPTVAVQPAPAPSSPPPRPVIVPPAADALVVTGAIATAVGGASLLLISLPSYAVRNSALRRAEREDALAFSSRRTRYERARRADDVMEGAFWVGAPLLVTGVALLVTGLAIRANARARSRMAAVPGGLVMRF